MHSRPDGFMLLGKLGVEFFAPFELLYPNLKTRLQLTRARPGFFTISDNPNVYLGVVDCSPYSCHIALKVDYHKKRMHLLAYTPVEFNCWDTLAKIFIIPVKQTSSYKKTFSTKLQLVGYLLQGKETLQSMDRTLNF